jgi:hypothetical protein
LLKKIELQRLLAYLPLQLGDLPVRRIQSALFGCHRLFGQSLRSRRSATLWKVSIAAPKRVSPLVEKLAMHTQLLRHNAQHLAHRSGCVP